MTNSIELRDVKKALEVERKEVERLNDLLIEKQHGLETTVDELIEAKKVLETRRQSASMASTANLTEQTRLLRIIDDEREQSKRINLELAGFRNGVKFVLQNLPTQLGSRDDY